MNHTKLLIILFTACTININAQELYLDPQADIDSRVTDLISRLTLEEKVSQMTMNASGIPRLNIKPYDYWNEALHGIGRSGKATIFPQTIGLAASFDEDLVLRISTAISDEARAKYNSYQTAGNYNRYSGLTFWTPNINIFRDPRWGRGQETYGEDPYLTSLLGVAFVHGLQGNNSKYLKTAACAKHFAVHSGPEKLRHEFNAVVDEKDLNETYLPAFKALIDAGVESVMCAYNRTNGEPCCANKNLLTNILLSEWEFKGHIVTDCGALEDFYSENGHKTVPTRTEAAALAIKYGINLNCGSVFNNLTKAVSDNLITESEIDQMLFPVLKTRFKLGIFDPQGMNPYDSIPISIIDCKEHRALAYEAAIKSVVMLKNNGVLPLKNNLNRYYVTGPNATSIEVLLGNYYGVNDNIATFLEGITNRVSAHSQVEYRMGTTLDKPNVNPIDWTTGGASSADATIVVMGLSGQLEGEEGESISSPYYGDRLNYNIPENQLDFLKKIRNRDPNTLIAVITGGCPMNLSEVHELADAVLFVWYPGEEGGNAVADIIFGKHSPSGRLPVTFPKSLYQLPEYDDYNMEGRTYRYMKEEPMYPFGFGLSYTTFKYSNVAISKPVIKKGEKITVSANITNTGNFTGEEVAQLYITDEEASTRSPLFSLKGIQRILLQANESKKVEFELNTDMLKLVNNDGELILEKGDFIIYISGSLPTNRSVNLGAAQSVYTRLELK